jgi:hypothetical protein
MIQYKEGYKYQLHSSYDAYISLKPKSDIITPFIHLYHTGRLVIGAGYAWDGPSGPTVDTLNFMRGSLVHDALYQLMRMEHLPQSDRKQADKILRDMCKEDGMSSARAWWVYKGVRMGGKAAADPKNRKEVKIAP